MLKFFCDRCGKEIRVSECGHLFHTVVYGKAWLSPAEPKNKEAEHILCPSCENSFILWFNDLKIGGEGEG